MCVCMHTEYISKKIELSIDELTCFNEFGLEICARIVIIVVFTHQKCLSRWTTYIVFWFCFQISIKRKKTKFFFYVSQHMFDLYNHKIFKYIIIEVSMIPVK